MNKSFTRNCHECDGKGWQVERGTHGLPEQITCDTCKGSRVLQYTPDEVKMIFGEEGKS